MVFCNSYSWCWSRIAGWFVLYWYSSKNLELWIGDVDNSFRSIVECEGVEIKIFINSEVAKMQETECLGNWNYQHEHKPPFHSCLIVSVCTDSH